MDHSIKLRHCMPPEQKRAYQEKFKRDTAAWSGQSQRIESTPQELAERQRQVESGLIPF